MACGTTILSHNIKLHNVNILSTFKSNNINCLLEILVGMNDRFSPTASPNRYRLACQSITMPIAQALDVEMSTGDILCYRQSSHSRICSSNNEALRSALNNTETVIASAQRVETVPGIPDDFYKNLVAWSPCGRFEARGDNNDVSVSDKNDHILLLELNPNHLVFLPSADLCLLTIGSTNGNIFFLPLTDFEGKKLITNHWEASKLFRILHRRPVTCLAYLPETIGVSTAKRTYTLLVGDEFGYIVKYVLSLLNDNGTMKLHSEEQSLLQLHHESTICAIAFNSNLSQMAVGANDSMVSIWSISQDSETLATQMSHTYCLPHSAAVKALQFCPWNPYLLATGAGANDRHLRIWYTGHKLQGIVLNQVFTECQITSLTWSAEHRQILVTFGFGYTPEKPFPSFACYEYPSLRAIIKAVVTPTYLWDNSKHFRVLYAIECPDGKVCLVCNDCCLHYFEIWSTDSTIGKVLERSTGSSILDLQLERDLGIDCGPQTFRQLR